MADSKKFLDNAGLTHLWGIIKGRFADQTKAVSQLSITASTDGKVQTLTGAMVDTTGTPTSVDLPNASESQAGLMSADHFAAVRDLQINIDKMAPFAGLQLDGNGTTNGVNEVSLTGRNRLASNSLLESLVFAKRAAKHIITNYLPSEAQDDFPVDAEQYEGYREKYKELVLAAIEKEKNSHE